MQACNVTIYDSAQSYPCPFRSKFCYSQQNLLPGKSEQDCSFSGVVQETPYCLILLMLYFSCQNPNYETGGGGTMLIPPLFQDLIHPPLPLQLTTPCPDYPFCPISSYLLYLYNNPMRQWLEWGRICGARLSRTLLDCYWIGAKPSCTSVERLLRLSDEASFATPLR